MTSSALLSAEQMQQPTGQLVAYMITFFEPYVMRAAGFLWVQSEEKYVWTKE